jgi:hypothetical protein
VDEAARIGPQQSGLKGYDPLAVVSVASPPTKRESLSAFVKKADVSTTLGGPGSPLSPFGP